MGQYRFKLTEHMMKGDLLLIGGIWYETIFTQPRYVGDESPYIQVFMRVEGADPHAGTDITIVFPRGAIVKVKSRKKQAL